MIRGRVKGDKFKASKERYFSFVLPTGGSKPYLTALIQEEKFLSLVSGFDSDCDVDPDPSFREIMKDVEIFGNTVLGPYSCYTQVVQLLDAPTGTEAILPYTYILH
ncbi:hypothetical protein Bca52824_063743 [Brassica carinata]|uniref:Uncharacterized protein n=1 Tax=Brassica carinata TaxID=52824 RepID=A0A8X7QGN7_BRACI|nr:hypothetical protein Bca52824_063743 [Brassica carinata]